MSKKCINCGASNASTADVCEYCGTPLFISLAHGSNLFSKELRDNIYTNLQTTDNKELDSEISLIILFLLDDLAEEAQKIVERLMIEHAKYPRLLLIKAIVEFKISGVYKASPVEAKQIISNVNIALSLGEEEIASEAKSLLLSLQKNYYQYNSINAPDKLDLILSKLENIPVPENCIINEIFN